MSLATIRTAIKNAISGVASVGVVSDWEPLVKREEDFKTYFASGGKIRGWTITRESSPERKRNQGRVNDRTHVMVIRHYASIESTAASEKDFQDRIETVCDTLRAKENDQLDGTIEEVVQPPSVRLVDARSFGGFVVHYGEIVYAVQEPKTF